MANGSRRSRLGSFLAWGTGRGFTAGGSESFLAMMVGALAGRDGVDLGDRAGAEGSRGGVLKSETGIISGVLIRIERPGYKSNSTAK